MMLSAAFAGALIPLASELQRRYGSQVHFYTKTAKEARALRHLVDSGIGHSITSVPTLADLKHFQPAAGELGEVGRDYERRIGRRLQELTFQHRFLGRGYSSGAYYYPSDGNFRRLDLDGFTRYYVGLLDFWERELTSKGVTLQLQSPLEAICIGRALGVPHRRLDVSRFGDWWLWTMNEFHYNTAVPQTYHSVPDEAADVDFGTPYAGYSSGSYFGKSHLWTLSKTAVRYNYTRLRLAMIKDNPVTHSYRERMRLMGQEYLQRRRYKREFASRISDLAGKTYVYLPLHKEPESGLQMMSPEFYNQHCMIMSVAQSLPAGVHLVLKENNKTFGRRPFAFYEQVADIKNTIFIDDGESSLKLIEGAACTVTVSGSAGFEAATRGKPVISFGRHNMYNCLPHIMVVQDLAELRGYFDRVFAGQFDVEAGKREGRRFLAAVLQHSFDLNGAGAGGTMNQQMIEANGLIGPIADKLASSLDYTDDVEIPALLSGAGSAMAPDFSRSFQG